MYIIIQLITFKIKNNNNNNSFRLNNFFSNLILKTFKNQWEIQYINMYIYVYVYIKKKKDKNPFVFNGLMILTWHVQLP